MSNDMGRTGRPFRRARKQVLSASKVCWLCGHEGADTVDHVIPLSKGGSLLDRTNLRPAHKRCNSRKGDRLAVTVRKMISSRDW